jgi:hypothetical protein
MADTANAILIPGGDYVDLNTLASLSPGDYMKLQNVGSPNDIIEIAISATQPAATFVGVRMDQFGWYEVAAGENTAWVRYIRIDRADVGTRTTKLQVQT